MITARNILDDFVSNYPLLTKKTQKVWRTLQHFCQKYTTAFPSHELIAKYSGCCLRTVNSAIKNFTEHGWVNTCKRPYRSSIYYLDKDLISFDTRNLGNFQRPQMQNNPTEEDKKLKTDFIDKLLLMTKKQKKIWEYVKTRANKFATPLIGYQQIAKVCQCAKSTVYEFFGKIKKEFQIVVYRRRFRSSVLIIPDILLENDINRSAPEYSKKPTWDSITNNYHLMEHLALSNEDKNKLNRFGFRALILAIEDYKTYSLRKSVRNLAAFLTSRCKAYQAV